MPIRVLYIDDDPGLSRLVDRALTRAGMSVTLCGSGPAGLERLREQRFDVVALDHYMPVQDGLATLGEISSLDDPPPVIFVTGADEGRVAVAALKAGAVDYVIKDVSGTFIDLLQASIAHALRQSDLRRAKEVAEKEVRAARDRAEALLREVNHRVANSLALVAAMIAMQQRALQAGQETAREALRETQNRISAIAQIHRRLYTSDDVHLVEMDAYLTGLVEELESALEVTARGHAIRLDAEPVAIPTDKAVSVGVIVNELVTNAYKYAYGDGVGEIRVAFRRDGASFTLAVEDDGVGMASGTRPKGTGLGSRIIAAMAANLATKIAYDERERGTRAVLSFAA